jgi:Tfp pilus assembly protein PilF
LPAARRTAQADAVLVALGYKSDKPKIARALLPIAAVIVCAGLFAAWFLMPPSGLLPTSMIDGRDPRVGRPQNDPRSPILEPRTAASNPPAVSAPAKKPESNPPTTSMIEDRDPRIGKPRNEPRSSIVAPRTQANTQVPPAVNMAPAGPKAVPAAPDEFQLALYYQRSGDFEQALMHYRAALQRDEMNIQARNNLGNLYLGKGLFEEAAREFQRVIAIDPKYLNAHVNLSAAYTRMGRPDAAAAEARAALEIDGRNPDAMVNLSLAQHDAGLTGDAQRSLRRALEIDPHNAAAHYNMARQFEAADELPSAIAHYNQFIQYASPEQTGFAADVRARVAALSARLK